MKHKMNKFKKKDYFNLLIISFFVVFMYFFLTKQEYIYGSTTDWKDQHFLFPEYFRNLFYSTGKFIPEFALNIGGGQNIFYFAYYGLLSPIILLSYMFPFIDMMHYIILMSIILLIVSSILFYKFLKCNNLNENICFFTTFIFVTASPLILHSHRHIMFVNYMPFLILGLMGIDNYFKNKSFWLITISTFLLIMTSYYYSVSSLAVLSIYFIYKYLLLNMKFDFKNFLVELCKYCYFILLGILMAAILLLPVLYTVTNGRNMGSNLNIFKLLIPHIDVGYILYDSYGIGLTCIGLISLLSLNFNSDKAKKFLFIVLICLLCIPIFLYILNGTLYINAKALIPFVPLISYIIGLTIDEILNANFKIRIITVIMVILIGICYFTNRNIFYVFLIDSLVTLVVIQLYLKFRKKFIIFLPMIMIVCINCVVANVVDELYSIEDYKKDFDDKIELDIKKIIENDNSFYRINNNLSILSTSNKIYDSKYYQSSLYSSTYNKNYNHFYLDVFRNEVPYRNSSINGETNNLLYQIYMGEKYIITNKKAKLGYKLLKTRDNYNIYENMNTLPIGYATDKIMSKAQFNKLEYPYTVDALLNYIIVDESEDLKFNTIINEVDIPIISKYIKDNSNKYDNNKYYLSFSDKSKIKIPLEEQLENKVLIITFDMDLSQSCDLGDTYIIINSVKNKLTCKNWKYHNNNYSFEYVIATDKLNSLDFTFSKGNFIINNLKTYIIDYENIEKINDNIDEFYPIIDSSKDNQIKGKISVKKDGYFILKVPFDNGFEIYIDGDKAEVLNVNDGFIGTKISKGNHEIKIIYNAPFLKVGKIVSVIGLILFLISLYVNAKFNLMKQKIVSNFMVKKIISLYKKYEEIINYLFIGGCTTIVSIVTYALCTSIFHIYYQFSNVISWIFSVIFAFITNKLFVFKVKNNEKLLLEIYQFIKFRLLSLVIDMLTMYILVDLFQINDIISKILVQFIVVVLNYVFSKLFIFKK